MHEPTQTIITQLYQPNSKPTYCTYCGAKLDLEVNPNRCWNCTAPITATAKITQKILSHPQEAYTAMIMTIIWVCITAWITTTIGLSYLSIILAAAAWLGYPVAYKLAKEAINAFYQN